MSKIKDTEFNKLLEQTNSGELDVLDYHIDKWQDMLQELLGIVPTPVYTVEPLLADLPSSGQSLYNGQSPWHELKLSMV